MEREYANKRTNDCSGGSTNPHHHQYTTNIGRYAMNRTDNTIVDLEKANFETANDQQQTQFAEITKIIGTENLLTHTADRYAYCRDRLPFGLYKLRAQQLPATLPQAIALPASQDEVIALIQYTRAQKIRVIPFGAS